MIITLFGLPASAIAARNPSAIDSTATKTMTTPATPIIDTADDPSRCGIVLMLSEATATVCENHLSITFSSARR